MIRGKPNVDAFLDGGAGEGGPKAAPVPAAATRTAAGSKSKPAKPRAVKGVKAEDIEKEAARRVKKIFDLPESIALDLEQRCVDERRELGRRVTQMEIVERALSTYLYGK